MYTLEQVQKHNKPDDVWIILHNKVYDVTKYLEDHPGGSAILVEVAGTDATEAFEETGHYDEAREELVQYYVGYLPSEVCSSNLTD
jgi:cytochrome-b5 reductase